MPSCWKPCANTLSHLAAWLVRIGRARPCISTGWPNGLPLPLLSNVRQVVSPRFRRARVTRGDHVLGRPGRNNPRHHDRDRHVRFYRNCWRVA